MKKKFKVGYIETVYKERETIVEASSGEEALEKVMKGEISSHTTSDIDNLSFEKEISLEYIQRINEEGRRITKNLK